MASKVNLDELLAPVRDGAPCGDDPWASGALSELETLAQGKPETQFSKAEEPDWAGLRARALEMAAAAKDLRIGSILTAALLRADGLPGFLSGLQLLRGYLDRYWPEVFPLLDATENNDPAERVNALTNLTAPLGSDGDLLKVVTGLRKTPLLSAPRTGRFGLEHYLAVKEQAPWPAEAGPAPSSALLDAAKKEIGAESVAAVAASARAISEELAAIEAIFKAKAGPAQFPAFAPLQKEIKSILAWLDPRSGAVSVGETAAVLAGDTAASAGTGGSFSGGVRSRSDVLRALESVIAYYRDLEPSSPVPFLLQRAMRIVPMDFVQLMNELTPEAREKINLLIGAVESSASA
ncbi:MAG: type VI secretion system protein TssA [Opitutaceae bacterium]